MPAKHLAKSFSRRSPVASWYFRMLVNMTDELQNASQFFRRFTIRPDPLDAQIARPGLYLFHSVDTQNQFPHYGQPAVLPYQVPMPHASPSTSSVPSSESESTTKKENPQPEATNRNRGPNWTDTETRYLLELSRDKFPISKKRSSIPGFMLHSLRVSTKTTRLVGLVSYERFASLTICS